MLTHIDIQTSLAPDDVLSLFSDPEVLDVAHGSGRWHFDAWSGSPHRQRRGVLLATVPLVLRFLTAGRKSIVCRVDETYHTDTKTLISTLRPKMLGAELVRNTATFTIKPLPCGGSRVACTVENLCFLPRPFKGAVERAMSRMTQRTISLFVKGIRDQKSNAEPFFVGLDSAGERPFFP